MVAVLPPPPPHPAAQAISRSARQMPARAGAKRDFRAVLRDAARVLSPSTATRAKRAGMPTGGPGGKPMRPLVVDAVVVTLTENPVAAPLILAWKTFAWVNSNGKAMGRTGRTAARSSRFALGAKAKPNTATVWLDFTPWRSGNQQASISALGKAAGGQRRDLKPRLVPCSSGWTLLLQSPIAGP